MGITKKIVVFAVILVAMAYWLYEPVPRGYSDASTRYLHLLVASMKIADVVIPTAVALGFGSQAEVTRAIMTAFQPKITPDPDINIQDALFDNVPVRIYTPVGTSATGTGFVYYHGGGWVLGDLDTNHEFVLLLCKESKTVIVSVHYRRAPEAVFPAAFEDAVAATKYFITHAQQYGVDPHRIGIGGDSAGGNLAATVALKLRDDNFHPPVKMQVLMYPVTQLLVVNLPSMIRNGRGPVLTNEMMTYFKSMYIDGNYDRSAIYAAGRDVPPFVRKQMAETFLNLERLPKKYLVDYERPSTDEQAEEEVWNQIKDKLLNPYLSPLLAEDLTGLPMTYVFTCEHDLLRDEGILYAERLKEAGNAVTHVNPDIAFHLVFALSPQIPEAREMLDNMIKYIVSNL